MKQEGDYVSGRQSNKTPNATARNSERDISLQGKSKQRALSADTPNTLTPYEWEEWYREHGVPDSHKQRPEADVKTHRRWWRWW